MGRCLQMIEKRNAAIKAYQDVVDYFPDDVAYAAGALFYIGQCHELNGDTAKQNSVWAKMVKDDDYVAQPNSGTALTYLGVAMAKLGKFEEAAEYQWRTAVAFAKSNYQAAELARRAVIEHYVSRIPNHEKLIEFYVAAGGFDGRGQNTDKPNEDVRYWTSILSQALLLKDAEQAQKDKVARYWTAKMGDRFTENDDLRKQWIDLFQLYENDSKSWLARMEKQYKLQAASLDRVLKWCGYYSVDPKLRTAFFEKESKPFLAALKNDEKMKLMNNLRHPIQMHEEARAVMRTVSTEGMTDQELRNLTDFAAQYEPEDFVLGYYARIKDKALAAKSRFDYYNSRSHRNPPFMEKALLEIPELKKSPAYAGPDLGLSQGNLLRELGRFEEGIKAFNEANKQPESTWGVADCLVGLKRYPEAVKTVQQLESVGGEVAPRASLKMADILLASGDKGKEVQQLRMVLKRYPKSGESSEAHNRLERYGVALSGGESTAEE
jgi:TolA-binding protein